MVKRFAHGAAPTVDALAPQDVRGRAALDPEPAPGTGEERAPEAWRGGPRHVAVIMDGNGRWAKARGMARLDGHRRGVQAVRRTVEACPEFGVDVLTLYAFSTENWGRPSSEVSGLMDLFRIYLRRECAELMRKGVRVRFLGDPSPLAPDLRQLMAEVQERTAAGERLTLALAINYGGRAEILGAARRLAAAAKAGELDLDAIDEAAFEARLDLPDLPAPDLIIRTSGEQRLSNFLIWQAAYSELYFASDAWPDFSRETLRHAIEAYSRRERRFGGVVG
ncbi:MAG: polyprenyl diphosphate synthase [Pseudomonadota bacterium]